MKDSGACAGRAISLRERREPTPSIADLAREVRISPFHFMRQFEALFGVTPHQFRIHARLDAAKQLLAMGQHSVTDVCLEVGFSSLGSFSALFTRRVGETPSAVPAPRARDGQRSRHPERSRAAAGHPERAAPVARRPATRLPQPDGSHSPPRLQRRFAVFEKLRTARLWTLRCLLLRRFPCGSS